MFDNFSLDCCSGPLADEPAWSRLSSSSSSSPSSSKPGQLIAIPVIPVPDTKSKNVLREMCLKIFSWCPWFKMFLYQASWNTPVDGCQPKPTILRIANADTCHSFGLGSQIWRVALWRCVQIGCVLTARGHPVFPSSPCIGSPCWSPGPWGRWGSSDRASRWARSSSSRTWSCANDCCDDCLDDRNTYQVI